MSPRRRKESSKVSKEISLFDFELLTSAGVTNRLFPVSIKIKGEIPLFLWKPLARKWVIFLLYNFRLSEFPI